MKPRLLIVDDDPLISESLAFVLGPQFDLTCASDRMSAVARLRAMPGPPDLALIDLGLPPAPHLPTEGFKLIGDLLAHAPDVRIVVLTGQNEESNARRARALGAVELVPKPCEPDDLLAVLRKALRTRELAPAPGDAGDDRSLIGDSPPMRKLRSQVDLYASSGFPALVEGESGSGKERAPSRAPSRPRRATSRTPPRGRSSSTRSASCPWTCRRSCCGCSRTANTSAWARPRPG
jgi:two-component system nitrogen regulation response regulator GlnG